MGFLHQKKKGRSETPIRAGPPQPPHLGASRTRLTLGTIQTAETLGRRRGESGVRRGPRRVPSPLGTKHLGDPRPQLHPHSLGAGGPSGCTPTLGHPQLPKSGVWLGGRTHSVSLHARQAGGSWQTTGTLGEKDGGDGDALGGGSGGVPTPLSPGKWHGLGFATLLGVSPWGAAHLGAGGATLPGTSRLASFTLQRRMPGGWHVPRAGIEPWGGGGSATRPQTQGIGG